MTLDEAQEFYFTKQAKEMDRLTKIVLRKIIPNPKARESFDETEFCSIAYELFMTEIIPKFRGGDDVEKYIYIVLENRFKDEIRKINAQKRALNRNCQSIDEVLDDESECTLADMIASDFDVFNEAFGTEGQKYDLYMQRLSPKQQKIVLMLMDDYDHKTIREKLGLNAKDFNKHLEVIRSSKNVAILY